MSGMDRLTGQRIEGALHIAQSVADILTTPIGSRVMRRDYGSRLPELIDQPLNGVTRLLIVAATAGALRRWEPRLALTRVLLSAADAAGRLTLILEGRRADLPDRAATRLTVAL